MININEFKTKDGISYVFASKKVGDGYVDLIRVNSSCIGVKIARSFVVSFVEEYFKTFDNE